MYPVWWQKWRLYRKMCLKSNRSTKHKLHSSSRKKYSAASMWKHKCDGYFSKNTTITVFGVLQTLKSYGLQTLFRRWIIHVCLNGDFYRQHIGFWLTKFLKAQKSLNKCCNTINLYNTFCCILSHNELYISCKLSKMFACLGSPLVKAFNRFR